MNPRRINLFAGAGVGKSTIASILFSHLKIAGLNVELVTEYVKTWAYQGRIPKDFDQVYLFAKQMHQEISVLRHTHLIITDCPLLMCTAYSYKLEFIGAPFLLNLAKVFDDTFSPLNIFLERDLSLPYNENGRFDTLERSLEMDQLIEQVLNNHCGDYGYSKFPVRETDLILEFIRKKFGGK